MVIQSAVNSLKDKPHDEKKVVASGIAIGVVIILLVGWGFLFLRKIQRGAVPTLEGGLVPQDQYDTSFLRGEQERIKELYQDSSARLREIRDASVKSQTGIYQNAESVNPEGAGDEFGRE